MFPRCFQTVRPPIAMPRSRSTQSWYRNQVAMGKLAPAQTDPRDTYRVSTASTRKPTHATSAMRQSIISTMAPPERMPLPPLNWNMQGYICPSRQKSPAQYLASVTASAGALMMSVASHTASTALSTSVRITTAVSGPPKVR